MNSPAPEQGFLAIADVSGYTSYLAGVELDHAQDILSDVTVTVVEAMAPFQLVKLEGDAAFAYYPGESMDGSVLQDLVEGTYVAFRNRLRDIKQASNCECNACVRIPDLDLKIVVHHGTFGRQRLMGLEEFVGSEVILVHRLLKNEVRATTGMSAYALYTQAAVAAAGIDPERQGLLAHKEQVDVAGEVHCWVKDLDAVWRRLLDRPRRTIPLDQQALSWNVEWPVPPQVAFELLTSPARRLTWDASIDSIDERSADGRRGAETVNHCMHGANAIVEEILDYRPPAYWLTKTTFPGPQPAPQFLKSEAYSRSADGGTLIELVVGSVDGHTPAQDAALFESIKANFDGTIAHLRQAADELHDELRARSKGQPDVPKPGDRFLTQPIQY